MMASDVDVFVGGVGLTCVFPHMRGPGSGGGSVSVTVLASVVAVGCWWRSLSPRCRSGGSRVDCPEFTSCNPLPEELQSLEAGPICSPKAGY